MYISHHCNHSFYENTFLLRSSFASKVRELSIIENLLTHQAKKCWLSRDCPSVRTSRSQIYKLLRSCFIITQTSTSLGHKIERRNAKKSLRGIDEEGHGGRESQHENLGCEEYLENVSFLRWPQKI